MKLIIEVFELYTPYDSTKGEWSTTSCHTEGMLGVKSGAVMSLESLNKAMQDVGHKPLSATTLADGTWTDHEDEPGRFDYNYIGDSDGFPDEDGRFLYDISIWLYAIEPRPLTQTELLKELA